MNYSLMKKTSLIARIQELEEQSSKTEPNLQVTACDVYPFDSNPAELKALATIIINDAIQIRNLGIKSGCSGLYIEYPPDPLHKGIAGRSTCCPITRELRDHIETTVLAKYQKSIATPTAEADNG